MLWPRDRLACSTCCMCFLNMLTRSSKRTVSVTSPLLILYMRVHLSQLVGQLHVQECRGISRLWLRSAESHGASRESAWQVLELHMQVSRSTMRQSSTMQNSGVLVAEKRWTVPHNPPI